MDFYKPLVLPVVFSLTFQNFANCGRLGALLAFDMDFAGTSGFLGQL